ncbi:hypothetical protein KCV87_03305 [Actinosynnema pretiosum subsp. pretiosum]|uniref:Uncharacterized protein n=2 Tax=Actinosynnema TaxID=40566 RepID=C6W9N9_ACTMD|nr:hypothetical protein [Actinosynnema mirum]ACU37256.1 hypothetical protein Amir_3354 [Actinosynnema mirum DSM 43827]AXX30723.1 hypothetical protein APASM_3358 [Actinosynnema pretiosum subsp. pretiosum]QUF05158.1 hypothetical protein KCV87_03305 [Actinosynnema pretiosum subsp. pretiosum]
MSLGLVDHVMVSLVHGVPPERLLAGWGADAVTGPQLTRGRWWDWAGRGASGARARLGVQRVVAGGPKRCLLVWETWTGEGLRPQVARAVTAGGGRMLAVGGTPLQARVLYAGDGRVLAEASALGGLRDEDPERLLSRALVSAGIDLEGFASGGALELALRMSGVDLDAQDPRALLTCAEVTTRPRAGVEVPAPGLFDVPVVAPRPGFDGPVRDGVFPGGGVTGHLL